MALNLDDINKPLNFHSCDKPYGTLNYKLNILSDEQQRELNKIKVDAARKCQEYFAKNDKYIRGIIIVILRFILRTRPKRNVASLIGKFFRKTSPIDIEDQILQYSMQREEMMVKIDYDEILKEISKTEAMKNFMKKKQARLQSIKISRGILDELVHDVPIKADKIMAAQTVDELWLKVQAEMIESDKRMERNKMVNKILDKVLKRVFTESSKAQIEDIVEKLVTQVVYIVECETTMASPVLDLTQLSSERTFASASIVDESKLDQTDLQITGLRDDEELISEYCSDDRATTVTGDLTEQETEMEMSKPEIPGEQSFPSDFDKFKEIGVDEVMPVVEPVNLNELFDNLLALEPDTVIDLSDVDSYEVQEDEVKDKE